MYPLSSAGSETRRTGTRAKEVSCGFGLGGVSAGRSLPEARPPIPTPPRKLMELANAVEPVQDGRIHIEKINGPFLYQLKGTPAEYKAGLERAIANGWLWLHESGTFVKSTEAGSRAGIVPPRH
jgi:hypothetical protein